MVCEKKQEMLVTASGFWIGVEFMPASVLQEAASHPRPILCGHLANALATRSDLSDRAEHAEWHDLALGSPIGQGYLLDLLRQRGPIEQIVLALPAISSSSVAPAADALRPVNDVLLEIRHAIEGLIAVMRGAEATLDASTGAGLTLLRAATTESSSSQAAAVGAFADEWITREAESWATRGLSLKQLTVASIDQ